MATNKSNAWKMERAGVSRRGKAQPRSNRCSGSDGGKKPAPGSRQRVWVGGYARTDGTKVGGCYRSTPQR